MSGPQTAQAKATLAASPSNSLESPCQKARSRLPAVLRVALLTMCEVSTCSASRARSSTGAVAWHTRFRRAPHKKRRTRRLSAPSTRNHGAVRGGTRQHRDPLWRDRRRGACVPHPPPCAGGTPRLPRLRPLVPRLCPTEMPWVQRNPARGLQLLDRRRWASGSPHDGAPYARREGARGEGSAHRAWDGG